MVAELPERSPQAFQVTPVGAGEGITMGLSQFKAHGNHAHLEPPMKAAAELIGILNKVQGASLAIYVQGVV